MEEIEVGVICSINGRLMRHMGDGKFETFVSPLVDNMLVKRFEAGLPICGNSTIGGDNATKPGQI